MKPIRVKELIESLKACDPNAVVAISSDGEGNGFSCMADKESIVSNAYIKNELGGQDEFFNKANVKKKLVKCVILWPSN